MYDPPRVEQGPWVSDMLLERLAVFYHPSAGERCSSPLYPECAPCPTGPHQSRPAHTSPFTLIFSE
jgi:hypothetical protein